MSSSGASALGRAGDMTPSSGVLPVTVVVPVHNRADALARALDSIAAQRPRRAAEVVVVDDGSSDASAEVARQRGARIIRHELNRGQVAARNTAITHATQPWIAFLDSDDEWLPEHLATLWALRDGCLFVGASAVSVRPGSADARVVGPLTREPLLLGDPSRLLHPHNFVTMSATMVLRDAMLDLGGFHGHGGIVEDLDMWVRLLERGRARISPRVTVVYHVHGAQITDDLPRTRAAHLAVARSLAARRSSARSLVERCRGAHGWDDLRDSIARREAPAAFGQMLGLALRPERARGAADLLAWRWRSRRASGRVGRDGLPTLAIIAERSARPALEGASARRQRADLTELRGVALVWRLIRRPAADAIVDDAPGARVAHMLGMSLVESGDAPGGVDQS